MSVAYDGEHEAVRRALLQVATPADPCWRCGFPLGADPRRIDLGHRDDGPGWAGLEHRRCNRSAGARKGNQRRRQRRERVIAMAVQCALAVEISQDRQHTSVVAAGRMPGGLVLLDLTYLDGTDPTATVLELQEQREVVAVVVDPHSAAATCIRPLEAAGVTVTRPTSGDVAEAHGLLLDELAAGHIRHRGQLELTAGMRALEQRRLGGAAGPERRGALVDVSPAVAAELALWALKTSPEPYDVMQSIW